jgi:hypothetical protein
MIFSTHKFSILILQTSINRGLYLYKEEQDRETSSLQALNLYHKALKLHFFLVFFIKKICVYNYCRTCAASWRKHPPLIFVSKCGKCGEIRNSCFLLVEKWNGSRHLVFWLLGTLIGLRDRVRGLVA